MLGQQRGVDIEQTVTVVVHKGGRKDAHKASQYHGVRLEAIQLINHRLIKVIAAGVVAMIQRHRWNACPYGVIESTGIGLVAEHHRYFCWQGAGRNSSNNGLQVRAFAADQDGQPVCHWLTPEKITLWSSDCALVRISPSSHAFSPLAVSRASVWSSCSSATTSTMPMPQLKVRYISKVSTWPSRCSHWNSSGSCQLSVST